MNKTRVYNAIATSDCDPAEVVTESSSDKLKCYSFTAEIEDWVDDESDATIGYRVRTGKEVRVFHENELEGMTIGQRIKIVCEDDRWTTIVWPCEA